MALRLWLGFPKGLDISKAIDKKLGAERKTVGLKPYTNDGSIRGNSYNKGGYERVQLPITAPATPEAQQWDGWGTALKPANEPIVLARKPLSEKTIAENVMKWGTGGINIDGCRIPAGENELKPTVRGAGVHKIGNERLTGWNRDDYDGTYTPNEAGRFPANVILDEEAAAMLDEQSGVSTSKQRRGKRSGKEFGRYGRFTGQEDVVMGHSDSGGASRFFYCAKASRKERGEFNKHPTVKPIALMEYLIKLVTPPEGIVLDPFLGSGTTALAALNLGRFFIGIELNEEYCEIARRRIEQHKTQIERR